MHRLAAYRERSRQAGDTIVEVLIAISIVSLVLTSAYISTNKNSQSMQAVQEKTQAQKLVERQIELLRAVSSVPAVAFCFIDDQGTPETNLSLCVFDQSGATTNDANSVQYHLSIAPNTPSADTYEIRATWDRLGGNTGNITMNYYEKK